MSRVVRVHAPTRLHFGMFSFGHDDRPQFGGVGVMIDPPAVDVALTSSDAFKVEGDLPERVLEFVEQIVHQWRMPRTPPCTIVTKAPRNHTGLGVGTQLGLAVALGLQRLLELPAVSIQDMALAIGRGRRSSIGTIGFESGGLIVDHGKYSDQPQGAFLRQSIPADWRFVLIGDRKAIGFSSQIEADAFARLPPVSESVTVELQRIANELTAALARNDPGCFGEALYQFGRLAGTCFAPVQVGPFATAKIAELVESIRNYGIAGVGQSSWGPTVFALTSDEDQAQSLVHWLGRRYAADEYQIDVALPNNSGAKVSTD